MRRGIALCGTLAVLNTLFIWGNSLLSGEVSGQISGGILQWLLDIFGGLPFGELVLRKLGHFTEFACLGMLLMWLNRLLGRKGIPLLWGLLIALTDETIQSLVPDRGPSVIDVWIDTAGFCVGMLICTVVCIIYQKSRKITLSGG